MLQMIRKLWFLWDLLFYFQWFVYKWLESYSFYELCSFVFSDFGWFYKYIYLELTEFDFVGVYIGTKKREWLEEHEYPGKY